MTDAVEKMWAGEVRLRELALEADEEATFVIRKMQEADAPQYEAQARTRHHDNHRRDLGHDPQMAAGLYVHSRAPCHSDAGPR